VPDPIVSPEAVRRALELQAKAERVGGITAGGGGRAYPEGSLVGGKVRLQAPEYDYGDLALRAAQAGALGGSVGLGGARATRASPEPEGLLLFRGLKGEVRDPTLSIPTKHGPGVYATTNPMLAATYIAPTEDDLSELGGSRYLPKTATRDKRQVRHVPLGGRVFPVRLMDREPIEVTRKGVINESTLERARQRKRSPFNIFVEDDLPAGRALVSRDMEDYSRIYPGLDPAHIGQKPSDVFAWSDDAVAERIPGPGGRGMTYRETLGLLEDAAKRLGYPTEDLTPMPFTEGTVLYGGESHIRDLAPNEYTEGGFYKPRGGWPLEGRGPSHEYSPRVDDVLAEVANDPRFATPVRTKALRLLKGVAKEVLRPRNIVTDATIGAGVGAGSAMAGHASAAPESAGLFSPPGDSFGGLVRPDDIVRAAEAMDAEREALRQERLREVYDRYGFGYVPHTARLGELNEILGGPLAR